MRTVLLHADDVGMCHGANQAFLQLARAALADELLEIGRVTPQQLGQAFGGEGAHDDAVGQLDLHLGLALAVREAALGQHVLWGVTPSLLAWPCLLMPPFAGLAWLGFMLILCYLADRALYARAGLQGWLTLRFRLSAIASLSCFIGAAGS